MSENFWDFDSRSEKECKRVNDECNKVMSSGRGYRLNIGPSLKNLPSRLSKDSKKVRKYLEYYS